MGGPPLSSAASIYAACTIVSPNYFAFARTLAASYVAQHPGQRFFVLIVADLADPTPFGADAALTPVMLQEIGLSAIRTEAMKYDILELNTNVKPTFLRHLLARYALDAVLYLDPDIFVYAPLTPVFEALRIGTAVLTPHMTAPVFDGRSPSEQDLLYNGTYNLGFIGISGSPEALRLLAWWEHRCLALGFSEGRTGLFVDQKWANLMPTLFDDVVTSRDVGLNMAYWNLHERTLEHEAEGWVVRDVRQRTVPLRFFHFSGIDLDDSEGLSNHTDRFTLPGRPDLQPLFQAYRTAVVQNRLPTVEALPYGFDRLSDGTALNRLARRLFAAHLEHFPPTKPVNADPFDAEGPFAHFARRRGLVKGQVTAQKATWKQFNGTDRRVQAVHRMLGWALRALGPDRYELLMRYLGHISVLRNQAVFLRDASWPAKPNAAAGD